MKATMRWVLDRKAIAIVRGLPLSDMEKLARALLVGGIDMMEVTFNQTKPETWSETAAAIQMLARRFDGKILPGAGTVISPEQLKMARNAGARYVISPNMNREIIEQTKALGLLSFPGAMTPTEIECAYACGADIVKVFPVNTLGAGYIKGKGAFTHHGRRGHA